MKRGIRRCSTTGASPEEYPTRPRIRDSGSTGDVGILGLRDVTPMTEHQVKNRKLTGCMGVIRGFTRGVRDCRYRV